MNKLKELINRWEQFDNPPPTDTFKKHNPTYLKFVDSGFARGENCPVEALIEKGYIKGVQVWNKIIKKK